MKDFNKTFDDALNTDSEAIIDGMTEMTPPEELTTSTPSMKVKKVDTKKATSWLPKRAPTMLPTFPTVTRR